MLPFADNDNGPMLLFLLALGLTVVTLMMRWQRYVKRRRCEDSADGADPARSGNAARPGHHQNAPPELDQWEVQMHETARDLMGRLDSKLSALEALIAEADRAAGRLEAALGRTPQPQHPIDQATGLSTTARQVSDSHGRDEIYMLADYGYDAAEIAHRLGTPAGEVELMLRLRQPRSGQRGPSTD